MHNIVSFSGGKDSTAMLLTMIEEGFDIKEIIFIDTGAEYKEMYDHINHVEKDIDRKITWLRLPHRFEYYMLDYEKKKGKRKGQCGYGWCGGVARWGTQLKKQTFNRYIREYYNNDIVEYQGIAFDEPERIFKNSEKKWEIRYPLYELMTTEKQALRYCYEKGYTWGGLYDNLDRVSCWCCRNKNLKELKNIYNKMPNTWQSLKQLEKQINKPYYQSEKWLTELEKRFDEENRQISFI